MKKEKLLEIKMKDFFGFLLVWVKLKVISDSSRHILLVVTQKLCCTTQKLCVTDAMIGEDSAALLASSLTISSGFGYFYLEGDALLMILAINNPSLELLYLEFF
jgi:hypothetical protein